MGGGVSSNLLVQLLKEHFAGRQAAICSAENFTSFGCAEWEQILDAANHLNVDVRAITYVRDVAPYYQAVYAQGLREGRHYCDLGEFCAQNRYAKVMTSLTSLLAQFGSDRMLVIHYESAKRAIDAPIMAVLNVDPSLLDGTMRSRRVNRSFTSYEARILGRLVQKTGQQFASELASFLLEKRPDLEPDYSFDSGLLERLRERHRDDIEWINNEFFASADILRISEARTSATSCSLSHDVEHAVDRDVADWCLSKLQSDQDADVAFVARKVANIDWNNMSNPALPFDFDPIAYLLLNSDVLRAGTPPCEHYISSGQHEGRRWKWENQ